RDQAGRQGRGRSRARHRGWPGPDRRRGEGRRQARGAGGQAGRQAGRAGGGERPLVLVRALRRYAAFVWIAVLALAALGGRAIFTLPSGIYPEMVFPRVVVVAHVGQIAADLVEA